LTEEETQECEKGAKDISSEVIALFGFIRNYREKRNSAKEISTGGRAERLAKIVTISTVTILISLFIALKLLPESTWGGTEEEIRLTIQVMVLFVYLLAGVTVLLQYLSVKGFFNNFTGELVDITEESIKDEVELMKQLDSLSTQSIDYVAKRLERVANDLGFIRSFLLGAIEKVGIFPGLIATIVAITKVAESTTHSWIEFTSIGLLGMYLFAFPAASSVIKFRNLAFILNQYLGQAHGEQMVTEK